MSFTLTARKIIVALVPVLLLAGLAPESAHGADRPSAAELDKRIGAAARQLEVLVERYNDSREDLHATRMQTKHLGGQLGPMTRDLERRQKLMGGLVSRTYQRTRSGPTIALFAADEPHLFVDKLLVLHQLATEEQRAVTELHAARTRVYKARKMLNALADQQRRQQLRLRVGQATVEGEIAALKQMRAIAYAGGSRFGPDERIPMPEFVPGRPGKVLAFAFGQLGKPYRWGAAGPNSYDCSGLALAAWNAAGVGLPHNAARQYRAVAHVSRSELRPGDLVFFYGPISHVGVYIGSDKMIHAPEYGENVRVSSIDTQPIHGFGRPG
ncbi:C40 family peptidase [Actinoplanes sp. NPDC049118]|uniref:C40 family peptidase n=1 Tax=Actinoplanes sp. NPDC049118 TaxID=3155769 RepID=UPI0033D4F7B4